MAVGGAGDFEFGAKKESTPWQKSSKLIHSSLKPESSANDSKSWEKTNEMKSVCHIFRIWKVLKTLFMKIL